MTVENGKIYETDYLDFTIDCVGSPTGECPCSCMHTVDEECTCKDLSTPIRVSIVRTPVRILYPLAEPSIFNGRPYEVCNSLPMVREDSAIVSLKIRVYIGVCSDRFRIPR